MAGGRARAATGLAPRSMLGVLVALISLCLPAAAGAHSSAARHRAIGALRHHQVLFERGHHWALAASHHSKSRPKAPRAHTAIVGGEEIAITRAPWQVAVFAEFEAGGKRGFLLCGGSIINATHVVTAGHCAYNPLTGVPLSASAFEVVAGATALTEEEFLHSSTIQERLVSAVRIHPDFKYAAGPGTPDDIAVLGLGTALSTTSAVKAIGLPASTAAPGEGAGVTASGYGEQNGSTHELNGKLYSLGMSAAFSRRCGGEADALFVCASSVAGSTCEGDSGGPLSSGVGPTLAGVVDFVESVGGQLCKAGAMDGFVNVGAPEIKDFIEGNETPPLAPQGGAAAGLSGKTLVGEATTCEPGSWTNSPTLTYSFFDSAAHTVLQAGASATYTLTSADVGRRIYCEVQASNAGGVGLALSSAVGPVKLTTAKPTVASVTPSKGPAAGGTAVTIKGANFEKGLTSVTIGSEATSVTVLSPTELTAHTPAHGAAEVEVVVSNSNGASTGGPSFTYIVPKVTSVAPGSGPEAGGTTVTLKGGGFEAGATVTIGHAATNVSVSSETELTARTSATPAGSYQVVVSDKYGQSSGGPSFTYIAPPPKEEASSGGKTQTGSTQGSTGSGVPTGGVLGTTTASVGLQQIQTLLRQLAVHAAKIAALLKAGGLTLAFDAPEAGTAVLDWYEVPPGAKLASARPVLVAAGQASYAAAGTLQIKVKLTGAGRRLLKHAKSLKLTAKATFTPAGEGPVSVKRSLTLKR